MRHHAVVFAKRVEVSAEGGVDAHEGTLAVEPTGVRWRPSAPGTGEVLIPVERIVAAEPCHSRRAGFSRSSPGLLIRLPTHALRFALAGEGQASVGQIVPILRGLLASQFAKGDEVRVGLVRDLPRGGMHAVLAVSDLSWGEDGPVRPIMVQVWAPRAGMAWKRRVLLGCDLHAHLRSGFDDVASGRPGTAAHLRELGVLLLRNTITPSAIEELNKLSPSFVTLVADELLAHLPWNAAHDGERMPLLDLALSQQIATMEPLSPAPRRARSRPVEMLVISNPTLDLPNADLEAASILRQVASAGATRIGRVEHLSGRAASRVAVLSAIAGGRYGVIHYAGHSCFDAESPPKSRWLLHDGALTAEELQQNIVGGSLTMVYSSSCEGGREGERRRRPHGERLLGIAGALVAAGVRSYIGAFWPVSDAEAAELAVRFYAELLQDRPISYALRDARRAATMRGDAFTLNGMTLFGDPALRLSGL